MSRIAVAAVARTTITETRRNRVYGLSFRSSPWAPGSGSGSGCGSSPRSPGRRQASSEHPRVPAVAAATRSVTIPARRLLTRPVTAESRGSVVVIGDLPCLRSAPPDPCGQLVRCGIGVPPLVSPGPGTAGCTALRGCPTPSPATSRPRSPHPGSPQPPACSTRLPPDVQKQSFAVEPPA